MATSILPEGGLLISATKNQRDLARWQFPIDFLIPFAHRTLSCNGRAHSNEKQRLTARILYVAASMTEDGAGDATSARERRKLRQARRVELAESKREEVSDRETLLLAASKKKTMKVEEIKSLADLERRGPQWYTLTIGSSGEKAILEEIETGLERNYPGLPYELFLPMIPSRTVTSKGKLSNSMVKLIPNTLYIRIQLSRDLYDFFRGLPRVIGFFGRRVGRGKDVMVIPAATLNEDVERLKKRVEEEHRSFEEFKQKFEQERRERESKEEERKSGILIGSKIRVITGPFKNSVGQIQEVFADQKRVKALISVFDQPAAVQLTLDQVEFLDK